MQHTSGPWKAVEVHNGFLPIDAWDELDGSSVEVCLVGNEAGGEQQTANARLIATSPDLLSSLIKAVTLLCSEYPRSQWSEYGIDAMLSSIASAQGCSVEGVLRQIGEADA